MVAVLLALATGCLLAALVIRYRRGWVLVTVDGRSMVPALEPGDRVLVRRVPPARVRIGQVVVVEEPVGGAWLTPPVPWGATPTAGRRWIVKRAVAGPGDPVPVEVTPAVGGDTTRVPPGHFVLLGDNRPGSCDSRTYGFVPGDRILGSVHRFLSPSRGDGRATRSP
ncbi:S26 family signal peptidase [Micromonospora zingiberis]|uniref:S26 family signal peptidase n=1 Tax=Micromonospora zingiberis TaxID=2053011 RepID=A0A4R0GE23_9ACTN|nr:S26 family signal peptidase [Micromonospora zingiberis]TCB93401.1 S26 family signal peptidase [Micromonospora zingiberis]